MTARLRPARLALCLGLLALAGCGSLGGLVGGAGDDATSLNGFRAANGRTPLASDGKLTALAQEHATDMARRNSLDHNGFMERRGPAGSRAENVAMGCSDSPCAIRMWIRSPGHRRNMLRSDVSKYGLASAVAPNGRRYWALQLGE